MTTVLVLERPWSRRTRVEGILRWAVLVVLLSGPRAAAQQPPVHWLHAGAMPPGAIGSLRLQRGGPLSGYFQPVRIRAPSGARIALAWEDGFSPSQADEALVGLQIGSVYRLKVTQIPQHAGLEIYPTVELIGRLYPPPGLALRFPIPIELTQEELALAAEGKFVTRVIYVENPNRALPVGRQEATPQPWIDARPGEDPLVVADTLGRPVAILRIGGRVPLQQGDSGFSYAAPPFVTYENSAADDETLSDQTSVPVRAPNF